MSQPTIQEETDAKDGMARENDNGIVLDVPKLDAIRLNYVSVAKLLTQLGYLSQHHNIVSRSLERELLF
jgi:hypothetical protein